MPNRRKFLQAAGAVPLAGAFSAAGATGSAKGRDYFKELGVRTMINAAGTYTALTASLMRPEVMDAINYASNKFVRLNELHDAVGRRIAELLQCEAAMVPSGAAAALTAGTAACVAGSDPDAIRRIPTDMTGLKTEVIIQKSHRYGYDHAVRNCGVNMVEVETAEQLEQAVSKRTAMIYLSAGNSTPAGPLSLENVARMAKPWGIPILVDAAAEVLTIPNVHLAQGATVVAYSGGKAICGPQCAGLLLGRKDILLSAWQASSPHHGPGRDNKVGREETLGMVAAVEAWVKRDHKAEWNKWLSYLETISKRVSQVDGVKTAVREPNGLSNRSPSLSISWDPARLHITGEEVAEEVARNKPRIALGSGGLGRGRGGAALDANLTSIDITAWMMQPGDDKIVADRLFGVLSQKRSPKPAMSAPAANLSGHWDVSVEFFSSQSQHSLMLEQDGNRLQGSHKGDFSVREIFGTIDGDQVRLRSTMNAPGDSIVFTFAGSLAGDTISGPVFMGEYLNAKFTAKRHSYPANRGSILVPGGPPLAN